MTDKVEMDTKTLNKMLDNFRGLEDKLFREKTLEVMALNQKNRIFLKTTSGKDVDGNKFKPYNQDYAKQALKSSVVDVNLTLTGEMLNSMTQTATDKEANIFFLTDETADRASENEILRPFFGISDDDSEKIFEDYLSTTEKLLAEVDIK